MNLFYEFTISYFLKQTPTHNEVHDSHKEHECESCGNGDHCKKSFCIFVISVF